METIIKTPYHHRVSQKQKEANDFAWYKHHIDTLSNISFGNTSGFGEVSEYRRMQANYDLYNNIIDKTEFEYVCKPYGDGVGELPANFTNRDITSGKIKVLLGLEMRRPFSWKVIAVNEEATTRKEQEEFGMIKQYVISEIMQPIIADIEKRAQEETKGRKLTPEEEQQIQQKVQQEIKAATPEEVRKYMQRNHQDPAEALGHQLLEYLQEKLSLRDKFNDGWKHGLLSGLEVFWEGYGNDSPEVRVINPLYFDYDKNPELKFIEDGDWAVHELHMTPSNIISFFGDELTEDEIDEIYNYNIYDTAGLMGDNSMEHFIFRPDGGVIDDSHIRVLHANFKSLRKIGFLKYEDQKTGEIQELIVDETYKLNPAIGDISIQWEYIPEAHEGYKIGKIYKKMRPVPGQYRDINNLYKCKLSYKGAAYDNMNSEITSLMDRMKAYQFYYNIIMYRIEALLASDKGKILLMNMNMIPKSEGIDIDKFAYYTEALHIGFLNPREEGNKNGGSDITQAVKEVDMSMAANIQEYINLAEYIEMRCGASVGITKAMEGQAESSQAVGNNQLNYTQSSYIIEPYFELHNQIKKNVIEGLLETAKVFYSGANVKKLSYVIDDFSTKLLTLDKELLDNSSYGLFVSNSSQAFEAKQAIQQLSHSAMQNQKAELSDVIRVIRSQSVQEAEELLVVAEERAHERTMEQQDSVNASKQQEMRILAELQDKKFEQDKELIILKEEERRETEIQKALITSMGFDPNKDADNDGTPDVLEVAKFGVEAEIKMRKQALEESKLEYQKKKDKIEQGLKEDKLSIDRKKANKSGSK
jgi:hypothetical protein